MPNEVNHADLADRLGKLLNRPTMVQADNFNSREIKLLHIAAAEAIQVAAMAQKYLDSLGGDTP